MTGDKISVEINGKPYEFAVNYGLMRRIGEYTKKGDPFSIQYDFYDPAAQYKYLFNILMGGLGPQKVTSQQIQDEIDTWGLKEFLEVINVFNSFFTVEPKEGEVVDPQQTALMGGHSGNSIGRAESTPLGA